MPPALEPVWERVLANIETTLLGINGGATYFFDVGKVVRSNGRLIHDLDMSPTLEVDPGRGGTDSLSGRHEIDRIVDIFGHINDETDVPLKLERLIYDIATAMLADHTRGGLAVETEWLDFDTDLPMDESDTIPPNCRVRFSIKFRAKEGDLTTAA